MKSLKSKFLSMFFIGYLDAIWFLVYGIMDKNEAMSQDWLIASIVALTITHIVLFIACMVTYCAQVEREAKEKK